jgi:putative sigma-54 modulation protein
LAKKLRRLILLFSISGRHIEITEALKKYAEQKTAKLPRYYNGINRMEVILDGEQSGNIGIEIIARGEHSKVFIVTEKGQDAYKCIDSAVHKLTRQLRRKKGREHDNKHKGADKQGPAI